MKEEKTIRQYIENFDKGLYNNPGIDTQCEAGWYDWFCNDKELKTKTVKLTNLLKQIMTSKKIDLDNMYIFFKNNCSGNGDLYDDFRICDIKTGNIVYTIIPASGHNSEKGKASVWGPENAFEYALAGGTWSDILKFFGISKVQINPEADEIAPEDLQAAAEKYDEIKTNKKPTLKLLGEDGNAFAILGKASQVARQNKMDWGKISAEAMSGDYDHLLQTMMKYFDVE